MKLAELILDNARLAAIEENAIIVSDRLLLRAAIFDAFEEVVRLLSEQIAEGCFMDLRVLYGMDCETIPEENALNWLREISHNSHGMPHMDLAINFDEEMSKEGLAVAAVIYGDGVEFTFTVKS